MLGRQAPGRARRPTQAAFCVSVPLHCNEQLCPQVRTMTGGVTWGPGSPSSCENSQRTRPNCLIRRPPHPCQGHTLHKHHLRHLEGGRSPPGPSCQGPTPGRTEPEDIVFLPWGTVPRSRQGPAAPCRTHEDWARTGVPTGQPGRPRTALPQPHHRHRARPAEQPPAVSSRGLAPAPAAPPPRPYPRLGLQEHVALHVLAGFAVGHASLPHGILAGIQRRRDVDTGSLASGPSQQLSGAHGRPGPPAWPRPRAGTEGGALSTARKGGRARNGGHPGNKAAAQPGRAEGPAEGCSQPAQLMAERRPPSIPALRTPTSPPNSSAKSNGTHAGRRGHASHLSPPKAKCPHAGPPRGTKKMSPMSSTSSSRPTPTSDANARTARERIGAKFSSRDALQGNSHAHGYAGACLGGRTHPTPPQR